MFLMEITPLDIDFDHGPTQQQKVTSMSRLSTRLSTCHIWLMFYIDWWSLGAWTHRCRHTVYITPSPAHPEGQTTAVTLTVAHSSLLQLM
jgi:hypothetical protein